MSRICNGRDLLSLIALVAIITNRQTCTAYDGRQCLQCAGQAHWWSGHISKSFRVWAHCLSMLAISWLSSLTLFRRFSLSSAGVPFACISATRLSFFISCWCSCSYRLTEKEGNSNTRCQNHRQHRWHIGLDHFYKFYKRHFVFISHGSP